MLFSRRLARDDDVRRTRALMAAEMDEKIREASGGRRRLRDALPHLMAWSYEHRRLFDIDELPRIFREATGVETRPILERWLRPPDDP